MPKSEGERCTLTLPNYTAATNIMKALLLFYFGLAQKVCHWAFDFFPYEVHFFYGECPGLHPYSVCVTALEKNTHITLNQHRRRSCSE